MGIANDIIFSASDYWENRIYDYANNCTKVVQAMGVYVWVCVCIRYSFVLPHWFYQIDQYAARSSAMLLTPVGRDPQKKKDPSTIVICQPYSTPTGNYSIWSVLCSSSRLEVSHPIWLRTEHPFLSHNCGETIHLHSGKSSYVAFTQHWLCYQCIAKLTMWLLL